MKSRQSVNRKRPPASPQKDVENKRSFDFTIDSVVYKILLCNYVIYYGICNVSIHTSSNPTETFISWKISFFRPKFTCPENLKTLVKCVNSRISTNSPFVDM